MLKNDDQRYTMRTLKVVLDDLVRGKREGGFCQNLLRERKETAFAQQYVFLCEDL